MVIPGIVGEIAWFRQLLFCAPKTRYNALSGIAVCVDRPAVLIHILVAGFKRWLGSICSVRISFEEQQQNVTCTE
jgi:hypothetical protein